MERYLKMRAISLLFHARLNRPVAIYRTEIFSEINP